MLMKEYRICMPLTVEEVSSDFVFDHIVGEIINNCAIVKYNQELLETRRLMVVWVL